MALSSIRCLLAKNPTVLPIWHCGFDDLNPCEPPYARNSLNRLFGPPRCVTVSVGTPFKVGGILRRTNDTGGALYSRLTTVVQKALYRLKAVAEAEHAKHILPNTFRRKIWTRPNHF
ncbi:unnamed protein product [Mesocestoides corti]|uniref:Tafazzin family protein n=1 Tax=Mesocestoides corti TaxID=53468 RepID=A0A0R3UCX7_MESCO|nr:unnamed protein product [Mesocestoides corti]